MKTIFQRLLIWALLLPFPVLASDPPTGGPAAGGGGQNSNTDFTDWIMFGAIILIAVVAFYGLTRVIRGRGMRG